MAKKNFNKRYIQGDLPWDIQRPDFNLVNTVKSYPIHACKAIDIGCGTGDNALWLDSQKFEVTGIDLSETAIEMAKKKATHSGRDVNYYKLDFLKEKAPGSPYGFVFDRGCFHTFDKKTERNKYAGNVASMLKKDGLWLSLIGNYDDGRFDIGPPKRTAFDVVLAVEPYFEILSLISGRFDSNDEVPSKIWVCLMKKRIIK